MIIYERNMIQLKRIQAIIDHLSKSQILSVEDAVRVFKSSPATIRRDFNKLADEELVERVHGGVRLIEKGPGEMLPFELREIQHSEEKRAIAAKAAELLQPRDVAIIDGGTTTAMLGACIPDIQLRIITNSVRLATILDSRPHHQARLEVYLTGGILYPHSGLLLGPTTRASVSQYHAQWAFLSVGGITEKGISNTNELVAEAERAMIASAEKVVILADYSKIGRHAMCDVCPLSDIHVLITNDWADNAPTLDKIAAAGVRITTVPCQWAGPTKVAV
jgi:DeoR/GlpR family transcriptional regulator of sugar metabolism